MYDVAVPPCLQGIDRARHLLGCIDGRADVLKTRLTPGMFDCETQLGLVGGFALRATFPLVGREVPDLGAGAVDAQLERAEALVRGLSPDDFAGAETRVIVHQAGDAQLEQTGRDYLTLFALPNLWFHLSLAFAIARGAGLDIGKSDFDGWHAYASGFRFVDT
jgi:hypothetical protein